ncbi:hypothetical protein RSOLAG22IIIB_10081 [Rhizoctonia solani]|uniref:Uncharacterized protein n=1 Tax=Rhizoctonia solani TaxID=456999 RepID=A0A0K6G0P1_9AGAM|nr:hypothetical protein RSOLAG22IIIB_10081 [Rhizoctonia solani]
MAKKPSQAKKSGKPSWTDQITPDIFHGLNINSTGREPSIRNRPPPTGKPYERKQKLARETLGKTENDMTKKLLELLSRALKNQVRLPFLLSEFEEERTKGIAVSTSGPFRGLEGQPKRLTIEKGPAVITDQAGVPIVWYFPHFIGTGLQDNLMKSITDLAQVYRPPSDTEIRDRRAGARKTEECLAPVSEARYMTRSRTVLADNLTDLKHADNQLNQEKTDESSPCTMEEPTFIPDDQPCPKAYRECIGEVRIASELDLGSSICEPDTPAVSNQDNQLEFDPVAYYFSPGWSQTGMQYIRPIQMSLHFRNALDKALYETVQVLEAKRLLDKQIGRLIRIIHPSLSRSMEELRASMSSVEGPTGIAVTNGWTSSFPCYGIAINRTTGLHRDSKGVRAGLDIIGVLGSFVEGGDLEFPDLNLCLEWKPGCLGALDGYDFRHQVKDWSGGSRVTLISFCRESTWAALKLSPSISRPTIEECGNELMFAKGQRDTAQRLAAAASRRKHEKI